MKILIWHWGRYGAGPRFAVDLAAGFAGLPGVSAALSLAETAEILTIPGAPVCDLPVPTYATRTSLAGRWLRAPAMLAMLDRALRRLKPDLAICAMPAMLDPLMLLALRRRGIASVVIAHDPAPHAGDGGWWRAAWDRMVLRRADAIGVLSRHVGGRLAPVVGAIPLLNLSHPPFVLPPLAPPRAHRGALRVLSFGRLRAYKGLDLLVEALRLSPQEWQVRVVGQGPETAALRGLRALPAVTVENRWVAEAELPALLGWADVVVLTHRQASQSGVAAAAIGAGRYVVAPGVGGLAEQLRPGNGVLLCAPHGASLAAALRTIADAPLPARCDASVAWRDMAGALLGQALALGLVRSGASLPAAALPSWPIGAART